MRGDDAQPASLFSYIHLEDRIPAIAGLELPDIWNANAPAANQ
jgi:hypothetical protein